MTNNKEHFVGIEVAQEWFDVAVLGAKRTPQFAGSKRGITKLLKQMLTVKPKLIVAEATGGYEESLVLVLFKAGLPVALVSPQRVRQYARAKGRLTMLQAEKNRLRAQSGSIRTSLEQIIVCLETQLHQMEKEIHTLLQQHSALPSQEKLL